MQGLEDISLGDGEDGDTVEEDMNEYENSFEGCNFDDKHAINDVDGVHEINFMKLSIIFQILVFHFHFTTGMPVHKAFPVERVGY